MSSIGIILSAYAADNLCEGFFGRTIALQMVPEAKIIYESHTGNVLEANYFSISLGLIVVFFIALVIFAFDFEKEKYF
jgi:hypothetical protein